MNTIYRIQIRNKSGPKIEPWGTSEFMLTTMEELPTAGKTIHCLLPPSLKENPFDLHV